MLEQIPEHSIVAVPLALVALTCWRYAASPAPTTFAQEPKQYLYDLDSIYSVLNPHPCPPLAQLLKPRALSNSRLVDAFDIDNALTTTNPRVHTEFKGSVMDLIRRIEMDYSGLSDIIGTSIRRRIPKNGPIKLKLAQFWKCVTMEAILSIMFSETFSVDLVDEEELIFVTEAINDVWNASKRGKVDATVVKDLHDILAKWTCPKDKNEQLPTQYYQNPLNFIMPAYETIWRTALQTQVNIEPFPPLIDSFRCFGSHPTTLLYKSTDSGPSVENVVAETLRINPPTKRIFRSVPVSLPTQFFRFFRWMLYGTPNRKIDILGIDVEAVHIDKSIWGQDAQTWDPQRQMGLTTDQKRATLPFGAGKLKCVAENMAPRLVGILVGRAFDEFEGWVIERGEEASGRMEWSGWSISRPQTAGS